MTHISSEDVRYLAQLSAVQLAEEDARALEADLETIVTFFDQLNELDTTDVEPTYQVTSLQNVWREDDAIDTYDVNQQELLGLAPDSDGTSIKVPKVLP